MFSRSKRFARTLQDLETNANAAPICDDFLTVQSALGHGARPGVWYRCAHADAARPTLAWRTFLSAATSDRTPAFRGSAGMLPGDGIDGLCLRAAAPARSAQGRAP